MRFSFSQDQLALRAAVRQVLERECDLAALRRAAERGTGGGPGTGTGGGPGTGTGGGPGTGTGGGPGTGTGGDASTGAGAGGGEGRERWQVLAELGAVGLLAEEAYGGLGSTEVELVGVLEEAGWAALPEPLAETAALAVPLLGGSPAAAAVAGGGEVATVGGLDVTAAGLQCSTRAVDGTLQTERVVGASMADQLVLFAPAGAGWEVHVVVRADVGVKTTPSIDPTRDLGTVTWQPTSDTRLADGDRAASLGAATADRAAVAGAAQLLGLADRMIQLAAGYAKDRRQFGRPIGSFQAVKHLLADARVRLEFARPATYRAACSLAQDAPARSHDASMAKALASDAADLAARAALQVHGAIGYTWECDLHLFMKRGWVLSASWGDATTHRARVLAAALAARGH